jgi:dTDP-4-dehydrorhamnose reductase
MRVLVTGAQGQLGTELLALLGRSHDLVGVDVMRSEAMSALREAWRAAGPSASPMFPLPSR